MLGVVIQIDAWDPVAHVPVSLRAGSHDVPEVCHLDGAPFWPTISKLPSLPYDFFDGAFGGQIAAPSSSMTIGMEPWPNLARYSFADARFQLWTGAVGAAWGGWTQRCEARVTQQPKVADGRADIAFAVDDRWLDRALLATYAGTTGIEGAAELKGQPKALALGQPRYVAGTLVDVVHSVWQVSGYGRIGAVEAALERLARFGDPVGDLATYDALVAAAIPAGRWATCLASGLVRFGAPPTGQVSFLVQGDTALTGGVSRRPGQHVRRLAQLSGGGDRVDLTTLNALDGARPYDLSLYIDQQTTAREVIQSLAASLNCVAGVSWMGKLFVLPVGIGAPSMTLAADGSALPPVAKVEQLEIDAPFGRLAITAERTFTVHALADIAFTATLVDQGPYAPGTTYREGAIVQYQGSTWLYINPAPTAGNAPPTLPTTENAFWRVLARAGADGRDGKDGLDGDGLPGEKGADGRTSFTHYAYANSPDGLADFSVNSPNGRAYEGSYTDFSEPDSLDPASYVWREYKGPPFGMDTRGGAVVAGNQVIKMSPSAGWDADAYSTVGYRGGASARFRGIGTQDVMAGLNSDPTADTSYSSLDYAWNLQADGTAIIYESSALVQENGAAKIFVVGYGSGLFEVAYDGEVVRYLYNNVVYRAVDTARDRTFYFDSSIHSSGGRITDIDFKSLGSTGVSVEAYTLSSIGAVAAGYAPAGYINGLARASGGAFDDSPTGSNGSPRSYTVCWRIRAPSDPVGEYWGVRYFDIFGNGEIGYGPGDYPPNIAGMAQLLNAIPAGTPVTIHTNDEPAGNILNPTLVAAIERCGGSVEFLRRIAYRGAYALIGVAGWGNGRGFEFVAGTGPNDPKAVIQANFIIVNNVPITSTSEEGNLVATLTNETFAIPTRGDGSYDVFPIDLSRGQMRVYFGGKDVTALATFTIQNAFNLDSRSNADGTYYAVGLYGDSGYSYLIASYAGQSIAKTITATKSKSGALIQVSADKQSASFSKTGEYVSGEITITTSRQNAPDVPRFTIITADGTVHGQANLTAAELAAIYYTSFRTTGPDNLIFTVSQVYNQLVGTFGNSFRVVATSGNLARDETTVARVNDGIDGANGLNGANGADGFVVSASPPAIVIPCYSSGAPKPSWNGGSFRIRLQKGGQEITGGVTYSFVSPSNIASPSIAGQVFSFAGLSADRGEVTLRATYAGVSYDLRVAVTKTLDGEAAFKSYVTITASGATVGATTVPANRTATVSAQVSYYVNTGGAGAGRGTLTLYWRNATDGGGWNLLIQQQGSAAERRNDGTSTEPDYQDTPGAASTSAAFTSPNPDKLIEYRADFDPTSGSSPLSVGGTVKLEVT